MTLGRARRHQPLLCVAAGGAVTLLLLAGCGGGGGGSSETTGASSSASRATGLVVTGKGLYTSKGCNACHSLDGSSGVGPTWKGLAGSTVKLTNGDTVTADAIYLRSSIEDPDKQIVAGFTAGVMSGTIPPGSVSSPDAKALVAFIESVR